MATPCKAILPAVITHLLIILCLVFAWVSPALGQTALTILHTSEHHGTLQPIENGAFKGLGGVVRRGGLIERIRRETRHVLLLDSGDLMVGTAMSSVFRGEPDIAAMKLMRYDALTLGNHDFDFGIAHLGALRKQAGFPFLCTNLKPKKAGVCQPFAIKSFGPLRVGLIGLIGRRSYPDLISRSAVKELEFSDPIAAAKKAARDLRKQVDLLVAVTHQEPEEDAALAVAAPEIQVIVGGHILGFDGIMLPAAGLVLHSRVEPVAGGPILVRTHQLGRTLGRLDIVFENGLRAAQARNLPIDESAPEDGKLRGLVQGYARRLDAAVNRTLGRAEVELQGDGAAVRTRETNFGNLLADLARRHAGAEIALVNGGAVRGGIPAGTVTLKRVMGVLPYDDPLIAMKLTGRQLSGAMENSVGELPRAAGRFLQVSGLNYLFDPAAPSGARVKQITVQRAQLQDDREYGVAVFGFIAGGGDGYSVFPQGRERVDHQVPLRDLLIAALKTGPLSAQEEGRIRQVTGTRQK